MSAKAGTAAYVERYRQAKEKNEITFIHHINVGNSNLFLSISNIENKQKVDIEKIKCSEIGIEKLKEIIAKYDIPNIEIEKEWIKKEDYEKLFLHNLIYPYGVARIYYFHWIPKEEMTDISIGGFQKGLSKYLGEERDFRIGEYVVWWSKQSCIKHLSEKIWAISIPLKNRNLPKNELTKLINEHKEGDLRSKKILRNYYQYLFEIIDLKYSDLAIQNSESEQLQVITNAINGNFSMKDFMEEQYENYKNEFDFEDIVLLEYCLIYESKIKKASR